MEVEIDYTVDLKNLEAMAILSGDKELLHHIHWLMGWLVDHVELVDAE